MIRVHHRCTVGELKISNDIPTLDIDCRACGARNGRDVGAGIGDDDGERGRGEERIVVDAGPGLEREWFEEFEHAGDERD